MAGDHVTTSVLVPSSAGEAGIRTPLTRPKEIDTMTGLRLALLGGGGFRVPLVYGALLRDRDGERRVTEVVLHDTDESRLAAMAHVLRQQAQGVPDAPTITATTDLDEALTGCDFVFSAIRVGGLRGRTMDERVALNLGLLGQETTGAGGLAYALRTVPVAVDLAERVARLAPNAWVINFTNPAGIITQAMQTVLGDRVVGICDSPIGLVRRACGALGLDPQRARSDYLGLNHLGWLRSLTDLDGVDRLPELLDSQAGLLSIEEGRLFGPEWLQDLGALPNEYLYYYYFTRDAVRSIRSAEATRGEFLLRQQEDFYRQVHARPEQAWDIWHRVRAEREATYLAEAREEGEERDTEDTSSGGYEGVALALMAAIARCEPTRMILNVRSRGVAGLPDHAVVEVACAVDGSGVTPLTTDPLTGHMAGLVAQVKEVEETVIEAALTGSERLAVRAFALHPLVDSVGAARELVRGYAEAIPEVGAVLGRQR